jgi:hypothetical protein
MEEVSEDNAKATLFWTRVSLLREVKKELKEHLQKQRTLTDPAELIVSREREQQLLDTLKSINDSLNPAC